MKRDYTVREVIGTKNKINRLINRFKTNEDMVILDNKSYVPVSVEDVSEIIKCLHKYDEFLDELTIRTSHDVF